MRRQFLVRIAAVGAGVTVAAVSARTVYAQSCVYGGSNTCYEAVNQTNSLTQNAIGGTAYGIAVWGTGLCTTGQQCVAVEGDGDSYGVLGTVDKSGSWTRPTGEYGVYGLAGGASYSSGEYGVYGQGISGNGGGYFVSATGTGAYGASGGSSGYGVSGYNSASSGTGVYGLISGGSGIAVRGYADGGGIGVVGQGGLGVSVPSNTFGVFGTSTSQDGVHGEISNTWSAVAGVNDYTGTCSGVSCVGVYGKSSATSSYGVYATSPENASGYAAGYFNATSTGQYANGVAGVVAGNGAGGYFRTYGGYGAYATDQGSGSTGYGLFGQSVHGTGVYGTGATYGVYGTVTSSTGVAGWFDASGEPGANGLEAVAASTGGGWAAEFIGPVYVDGALTVVTVRPTAS